MQSNTLSELLNEIVKIRELLELLAEDRVRTALLSVATTHQRRQIWKLLDGRTSTSQISKELEISIRTIQQFVKELGERNLIYSMKRGHPQRRVDIVPWR